MIRFRLRIDGYINAETEDEAMEILEGASEAGVLIERATLDDDEVWTDPYAITAGSGEFRP